MAITHPTVCAQLDATIQSLGADQHHLLITSVVPSARRPEHQVRYSSDLTTPELRRLRDVIDQALTQAA